MYDITDSTDVSFSKLKTGKPGMPQSMVLKESDMTERLTKKSVKAGPTTQVCRHQAPPSFCGRSNHDYRGLLLKCYIMQNNYNTHLLNKMDQIKIKSVLDIKNWGKME